MAHDKNDVSFALSTWRKINAFLDGVEELHLVHPLFEARSYLLLGTKNPAIPETYYEEVRRLQEIRKSAVQGEMVHIEIQVKLALRDNPEEMALLAQQMDTATNSVAAFLGEDVLSGEAVMPGFPPGLFDLVPSLQVYNHLLWFSQRELDDMLKRLSGQG